MPHIKIISALILSIAIFLVSGFTGSISAATVSTEITTELPSRPVVRGETFFTTTINFNYSQGEVFLSSTQDLLTKTIVDDGIKITVYLLKGTLLSVHSPVKIDVYNANGNHTGLNEKSDPK